MRGEKRDREEIRKYLRVKFESEERDAPRRMHGHQLVYQHIYNTIHKF